MHIQEPLPPSIRGAFQRAAKFLRPARGFIPSLLLGCALALTPAARAGLISTTVEGPANAPNAYNLTVEFQNGDYYNFVLRSTASTITGFDLINTVASLTPGMSVAQVGPSAYGYYVNGITIGSDSNPGYNSSTQQYWTYWNGTSTNPVQWTFAPNGESSTTLTPGQADGWVYSASMTQTPQATGFAVPEPGAGWLVGVAVAGGWLLRRRGAC